VILVALLLQRSYIDVYLIMAKAAFPFSFCMAIHLLLFEAQLLQLTDSRKKVSVELYPIDGRALSST
jgi:hypothetical protein